MRRLPRPVARFRRRAARLARRTGHAWALDAATSTEDLATLLELAGGRGVIVELGTGPAWTTIALAMAAPGARVTSYDPVVHEHRREYLELVDPGVRERIDFVQAAGDEGPGPGGFVDMLFIDSTHQREPTLAEFRAWRARLAPGAVVAFHDYRHPGFPGVEQAVRELGLEGEVRGGMFVWRNPDG